MNTEQSMATGAEPTGVTQTPAPKAAPTPGGVTVPGDSDEGYSGIAHDFETCKAMLREALKYIGECPHHVFKEPRKVVDFYTGAVSFLDYHS